MATTPQEETLVYDVRLSSVGPGQVTGSGVVHEPTNMDLAMKLHYLRGVYFFSRQAVEGLTNMMIKETTFGWLNYYSVACGRFRRSESGRPLIKCNDCGVRFIEAKCEKTVLEWLEMKDCDSLQKLLVSQQVIGPDLEFSPPTLIQVTRFKCGGISLGLSWAHVLGDAFFCVDFFNMLGQVVGGLQPSRPPKIAKAHIKIQESENLQPFAKKPISAKWVDPVGDLWITANNCKMDTFSFHLRATELGHLQSKVFGPMDQIPIFETICALIWQCLAKIRKGSEPKLVTICKNDSCNWPSGILSNSQIISIVKADLSIVDADLKKLATLLVEQGIDERSIIEEGMERDHGVSDCVVYGANLTFVNLEGADLYGLEFNGEKPIFVNYTIQGVGDEGVVLVLPGPKDGDEGGYEGRVVTIILPDIQVLELKSELKEKWSIA